MNLENLYHIKEGIIADTLCNNIVSTGDNKKLSDAKIQDGNKNNRLSKISWLNDDEIMKPLKQLITISNNESNWKFSIREFEPLQYTVYNVGDHYDWHIDSHTKPYDNGLIRKLSFTMCLNDDFEGGEFSICNPHPIAEKTKVTTFKKFKKGTMIVFPSHVWHKVSKVTKGNRKTLVGWVVGTQFI